jgi:hypothetical protein
MPCKGHAEIGGGASNGLGSGAQTEVDLSGSTRFTGAITGPDRQIDTLCNLHQVARTAFPFYSTALAFRIDE